MFTIKELAPDGKSWLTQCAPQAPEPFAPTGNVFKKEGEYWTITYGGAVVRMKDAKGLRYLVQLLRHPDQEIHVLDLVAEAEAGSGDGFGGVGDGLTVARGSGAGPILDATAKAQYKRRLAELREELEEAERFNDTGRAERARVETEALTRTLSEAVGLGGRDREAVSNVERARVMVTLRIRSALKKIRESRPVLGHHFDMTVKTGRYCTYVPDPASPVSWVF
jgi:non-specific serine/threonine protein kinase